MTTLITYVVRASAPKGWDCDVYLNGVHVAARKKCKTWDEAWSAGQRIQYAIEAAAKNAAQEAIIF
jgi:hypothetical protein